MRIDEILCLNESEDMSQTPKISRQSLVRDYFRKIRMFSRNARLFLSATFLNGFATGIWVVLFNLYLLDLGFREDFIGYMLLLGGLAAGLAAFPAGIICGKVGRKKTLLTGVAVGSIFNAILVFTSNPILLLTVNLFQGFGGLAGILFWVAQAPFMMENSEPEERTHLFSINLATWFLSNMAGSFAGRPRAHLENLSSECSSPPLLSLSVSDSVCSQHYRLCTTAFEMTREFLILQIYRHREKIEFLKK